jgi:hypothetical protein
MFGKPQWFRPKVAGFGLVPIKWQGWLYTTGWAGTMGLPFLALVWRHQPLEAAAWLGFTMSALTYDVWQILKTIRGPRNAAALATPATQKKEDNVLYILDSHPGQPLATRNCNLQVRG